MKFKRLVFLAIILIVPFNAFAVRIDKSRTIIKLSANQEYTGSILIENTASTEAKIMVYLQDFKYVEPFDGSKDFYPPGLAENTIANWTSFTPQQFTLAPFARQRFTFKIKPDRELKTTHCGVFFFETQLGTSFDNQGQGIKILGAMGSLVFVQPADASKLGQIKDIKGSTNLIRAKLENNGKAYFHAQGTYFIMDEKGVAKQRGSIRDIYILPQDSAEFLVKLPIELAAGKYTAVLTLDLEDDDLLMKEIDFALDRSGEVAILKARD